MIQDNRDRAVSCVLRYCCFLALTTALLSGGTTIHGQSATQPERRFNRPYMGWSSWSLEATKAPGYGGMSWVTAEHIERASDLLHAKLQRYGYTYVNIDSGWMHGYDAQGCPIPDPSVFPGGITSVAKHIHKNGQKLGLYWIPGINDDLYELNLPILGTSARVRDIVFLPKRPANGWRGGYRIDYSKPAASAYINSLVSKFASWGIDFLKLDGVTPGSDIEDLSIDARDDVATWNSAIRNQKRRIWLTLSWRLSPRYLEFWARNADAIRVDDDVETYGITLTGWEPIARRFDEVQPFLRDVYYRQPCLDLDSLDIGCGSMDGLTLEERRSTMTLWAILCAPLYTGDDLEKIDVEGIAMLTQKQLIRIDQAGRRAKRVFCKNQQVWRIDEPDGTDILAIFNLANTECKFPCSSLGLRPDEASRGAADLWSGKAVNIAYGAPDLPIGPHGCRLLQLANKHE